jgi:hypothetical protein
MLIGGAFYGYVIASISTIVSTLHTSARLAEARRAIPT